MSSFPQEHLPADDPQKVPAFKTQLLKWVGNKQRFAHEIVAYFPSDIKTYYEPFFGSGAVLATLNPHHSIASDVFKPLMDIWQALSQVPQVIIEWYRTRYALYNQYPKPEGYQRILASYNA